MVIDVKTRPDLRTAPSEVGAGWWLDRLARVQADSKRQARLKLLDDWYRCDPPLPNVAANAREALKEFHRHCRTNFAALIADSVRERQRVRGIRTSVDSDSTGDAEAWDLYRRMRMPLVTQDALRLKSRFGEASILVDGPQGDEPDTPVATAEDPRWTVFESDPMRPWIARGGLKIFRDDAQGLDLAYLYRPGRVDVAAMEIRPGQPLARPGVFDPRSWDWAPELADPVPDGLMPLIPFVNLDGLGEFEPHLDLLRRINFMILQRLTIAVLQAFRQRAVKGLPNRDASGREIDYDDIFTADPGAIWLMPQGAEIWESGQVDLRPILDATLEDIRQLAAVARQPMHTLQPGGENQSAEGAAFARESLVFKVEDRNSRDEHGIAAAVAAGYRWLGDEERGRASRVSTIWAPPQRSSVGERANSVAQAATGGVPFRTRMIVYGEHDPADVDRMETERQDDLIFAQQLAMMQAAATPADQGPVVESGGQPDGDAAADG